jgi:hypothetical protein
VEQGSNHHIRKIITHKSTTAPLTAPMTAAIGNPFFSFDAAGGSKRINRKASKSVSF